MDYERALLSKITSEGDLHAAIDAGVRADMFMDHRNRRMWDFIHSAVEETNSVPSQEMARDRHDPTFKFKEKVTDSFENLAKCIQQDYAFEALDGGIRDALDAMEALDETGTRDVRKVREILAAALATSNEAASRAVDHQLVGSGQERLQRYDENQRSVDSGELIGIPMGLEIIDNATQGFQPEQLITIGGVPKAGKSTMLVLGFVNAIIKGYNALMFSFEMSPEEQEARIDSMLSEVPLKFVRGNKERMMNSKERKALQEQIEWLDDSGQSAVIVGDVHATTTVSSVTAKVNKYRPDIVFIDGVYLMQAESSRRDMGEWERLADIVAGLKRMAQQFKIPVVINTQLSENKLGKDGKPAASSFAWSQAFRQFSDLLVAVDPLQDMEGVSHIILLASRNSKLGDAFAKWDWDEVKFEQLDGDPREGVDDADYSYPGV